MRAYASIQVISSDALEGLFDLNEASSGWVGETEARSDTNTPAIGKWRIPVHELYAKPKATQKLLDDASINMEAWLAGKVAEKFARDESAAFVSGNGTNNRPNGILTYITGGTNAAAHPFGAILATNSGAAAALTADGIINLVHALPSEYTQNARFVMNRATMGLARLLKDTTNQYLWQPSYQAGQPATLAGHPVTEVAAMPNVAAGARPIVFGDFQRGYLSVDRTGVRVLRDPFTNKPYVHVYTTKRVGGGLLNPDVLKAMNISA
jgi:HK97 family phage major capsid protein